MKIQSVSANNRKKAFELKTRRGVFLMPYAQVEAAPTPSDRVTRIYVDDELGKEGFTYLLESGAEGSVHIDDVLSYNEDPRFMRDLLLYKLTIEAQECVKASRLSTREIIRRAGTSPAQFYRLLDQTNYRKTVDGLLVLFAALDCEVTVDVHPRGAARAEMVCEDLGSQGGGPQSGFARGCQSAGQYGP